MSNNSDVKKKLAYVDFWTHKDTKSGDFLREILSEEFEIKDFWWKPREKFPLNELKKYDYIFFFHIIFPYQHMKHLSGKNIMWAPMYDGLDKYGVVNFTNPIFRKIFWRQMSSLGIKILKFSNKIDESIGTIKLETLSLRYYLKPASLNLNNNSNKLKIFFWDRGGIKIKEWIKFFDEKDIDEITYFSKPDYGRIESDIKNLIMNKRLKVNILKENFFTKEKFIQIISKNDVFVCPRKKEGIGMTIVEAISRGMFIIGYNDSTMNEYINESNIGFLFDETTDEKININNILDHYEARKLNAENKYNNWLKQKKDILPLFKKKPTISKKITDKILFMINDINYLFKKILKINYFY